MKPKLMQTAEGLKKCSITQRKCYFSDERPLKYFNQYTKRNCELECEVDRLLKDCGCLEIYIENRGDVDVCAPKQYNCTYFHIHQLYAQNYLECNCLPSCSSIFYEAEVSVTGLNVSDFGQGSKKFKYSQVIVYFKETQFMTAQRTELYGVTEFLASCGGLLGLFLGISVISLFEIVYFSTCRWCSRGSKRKIKPVLVKVRGRFNIKSKRLLGSIKKLLKDYGRKSTIQGLAYMAERNLSSVERAWWVSVVAISVLCCGSLIADLLRRYQHSPVIISYESQETSVNQVPFPAVTVCSQFVISGIGRMYYDLKVLREPFYDLGKPDAAMVTAVAQVCDPDIFGDLDPKNETTCDTCSDNLLHAMGEVDEILKLCHHTHFDKLCSEMFRPVVTEDGVCFTYNGLDIYRDEVATNEDATQEWTLETGYLNGSGQLDVLPRAGSMQPLLVFLRVNKRFADGVCKGPINGFRVYLHLPNEVPQISKHYYVAPYQQLVTFSIGPRMIKTAAELRNIPVDKRQCYFSDERYLRFFKSYTQSNCEFECLANLTMERCGCTRFNMPSVAGVKSCGIGEIRCYQGIQQSTEKYLSQNQFTQCNCLPACTSISYDAEINQLSIPDDSIIFMHKSQLYVDTFNIAEFWISMRNNQFIALKRTQLYGKTEVLANCGGLLAVFLGFSMVSVMEFVYFFVIRCFCKIKATF